MHRPVVSCCHSTFLVPSNQSCLLSVFDGARSVVIHSNRECMHDCSILLSRGVHTGKSSLSHKRWLAFALQCFSCCCLALAPWTNRLGALTSGRVVVEAVGVEVEAIGMEVEANGVEVEANGVEVKEIGAAAVGTMGGGNRAHRRCQIQMQHWNLHPSTRPKHRLRKSPRRAGTHSVWRQLRPRLLHTMLEQRRRLPGVSGALVRRGQHCTTATIMCAAANGAFWGSPPDGRQRRAARTTGRTTTDYICGATTTTGTAVVGVFRGSPPDGRRRRRWRQQLQRGAAPKLPAHMLHVRHGSHQGQ